MKEPAEAARARLCVTFKAQFAPAAAAKLLN